LGLRRLPLLRLRLSLLRLPHLLALLLQNLMITLEHSETAPKTTKLEIERRDNLEVAFIHGDFSLIGYRRHLVLHRLDLVLVVQLVCADTAPLSFLCELDRLIALGRYLPRYLSDTCALSALGLHLSLQLG
jgi:hypothetical protein